MDVLFCPADIDSYQIYTLEKKPKPAVAYDGSPMNEMSNSLAISFESTVLVQKYFPLPSFWKLWIVRTFVEVSRSKLTPLEWTLLRLPVSSVMSAGARSSLYTKSDHRTCGGLAISTSHTSFTSFPPTAIILSFFAASASWTTATRLEKHQVQNSFFSISGTSHKLRKSSVKQDQMSENVKCQLALVKLFKAVFLQHETVLLSY